MPALNRRLPTSDLRKSAISMDSNSSPGYYPIIDAYGSVEDLDLDLNYPVSQVISITSNSNSNKSHTNLRLETSTQHLHDLYHSSEEEVSPSPDDYTDGSSTSSSPSSARHSVRSVSQNEHDSDSESDYADFYGDEEPTFHDAGKVAVAPCGPEARYVVKIVNLSHQAPIAKRTTNAAYRPWFNSSANTSSQSVAICTATAVQTSDIDFARKRLSLYDEKVAKYTPVRTTRSPPLIPARKDSLKSNTSATRRKPVPSSNTSSKRINSIAPEMQSSRPTSTLMEAEAAGYGQENTTLDEYEPELLMRESDEIQNRALFHKLLKAPTPTSYAQYDPFALSPPRLSSASAKGSSAAAAAATSNHQRNNSKKQHYANSILNIKKASQPSKRDSTTSSLSSHSSLQLTLTKSGKWGADRRVEGMVWPKSMEEEEKPTTRWKGLSRKIVAGGVKRRS